MDYISKLPINWELCTLPELITSKECFTDGDWVESKDQDPNGDVRLIQLADIGDGIFLDKSSRFLTKKKALQLKCSFLEKGDVLIARMPDPLGRSCVFPFSETEKYVTVVDVCLVRLKKSIVVPLYLSYIINSLLIRRHIEGLQVGTTRKRISRKNLATISLPIAPYEEQKRIVSKIEELFSCLDAGVEALQRAQSKLKQYRSSLLKSAVEGKLTEEWRKNNPPSETGEELLARILKERRAKWEQEQLAAFEAAGKKPPKNWQDKYKEPSVPDTQGLPLLPESWCWASLEQLSLCFKNGISTKPSPIPHGVKILRISSVRPMSLNLNEIRYLNISVNDATEFIVHNGDLLFTRYNGSIDFLGVCAFVDGLTEPILHPDKLIKVSPVLSNGHGQYLEVACNVGESRKYIQKKTRTTAGQSGISGADLKGIPVPICSTKEQAQIISTLREQLSVIGLSIQSIDNGFARASRLRQAILKKAFEGRLVPQDPNDEPASVLLERIRREREESAVSSKPRQTRRPRKKKGASHADS